MRHFLCLCVHRPKIIHSKKDKKLAHEMCQRDNTKYPTRRQKEIAQKKKNKNKKKQIQNKRKPNTHIKRAMAKLCSNHIYNKVLVLPSAIP